MNLRKLFIILGSAAAISVSAQQINPITQAMLDGYEALLSENPQDYFTYYERASQYYRMSRYDLALNDIKKSIQYTPAKEKSQLASEYSLCADIYTQLEEYPAALLAINKALEMSPNNYPYLYMKGNICLYLNDLNEAKVAFQTMTRVQSRSQEAVIGLSKIAILEGNLPQAETYIEQAEKFDPSNYVTYCRAGDLHRDMGRMRQAAADYISAFCLNTSSERPMGALINLAEVNYDAAMEAVDYALSQTNNELPLNFLRGNIALRNKKYSDAYESYRHLVDNPQNDVSRLASTMAEICLGMGNLPEADRYINQALRVADNAQNNLLKAQIEGCTGNVASAILYADKALRLDPQSEEIMRQAAVLRIAGGKYNDALSGLNNLILNNPLDREALLLRGYLSANKLVDTDTYEADYSRAALGDADNDEAILLKAIAQLRSGKIMDAEATIAPILKKAGESGDAALKVAIYMVNAGQADKAAQYKAIARELGCEDEYALSLNINPVTSLKGVGQK